MEFVLATTVPLLEPNQDLLYRFCSMARNPRRMKAKAAPRRRRQARAPKRGPVSQTVAPPALQTTGRLPRITADSLRIMRSVTPVVLAKAAVDYAAVLQSTLADLQGVGDFTSLFDMYKITKVMLTIRAECALSVLAPIVAFVASDYDGGAAPDINLIQQRRHMEVIFTPDRPTYTFTIIPKIAISVGTAAGGVVSSALGSPWLDLASTTVPYYGVAIVLKNYNTAQATASFTQSATYCVALRSVR